jgi:hypothetical protein
MSTVDVQVTVKLRSRAKLPQEPAAPRMPRITRLMALAIKFQDMVDRGEIRDYADLARLGYVTRARITQIMNLLNLAPEIQEMLLFPSCDTTLCERRIRATVSQTHWAAQRAVLRAVK